MIWHGTGVNNTLDDGWITLSYYCACCLSITLSWNTTVMWHVLIILSISDKLVVVFSILNYYILNIGLLFFHFCLCILTQTSIIFSPVGSSLQVLADSDRCTWIVLWRKKRATSVKATQKHTHTHVDTAMWSVWSSTLISAKLHMFSDCALVTSS